MSAPAGPAGMPPPPDDETVKRLLHEGLRMAQGMRIKGETAIRRLVGNSEWRSEPERMAAAEAKRAKRRARSGGASS